MSHLLGTSSDMANSPDIGALVYKYLHPSVFHVSYDLVFYYYSMPLGGKRNQSMFVQGYWLYSVTSN